MSYFITAIVFVLIFSLLILIHELGHFYMARRAGIKVEEFGFGLPPRIWGKKKGDTLYSINAIPFGGFVRMMGEDAHDPNMLVNKDSFASKTMRQRVGVLIAGVFMNFVLAWFLLFVGFTFGMEPLLTPDDVLPAIDQGVVKLKEGIKVESVVEGSFADEAGFMAGDVLYAKDGEIVNSDFVALVAESPFGIYRVNRGGEDLALEVGSNLSSDIEGLGIGMATYSAFPRVRIFNLAEDSNSYNYGLRQGDVILRVNGREVFYIEQYEELVRGEKLVEYEVYRDGKVEKVLVELDEARKVIVSRVLPNSQAAKAGLVDGDVIVAVGAEPVSDSTDLIAKVEASKGQALDYLIQRASGEQSVVNITSNEQGKIGVALSELMNYGYKEEMSVYSVDLVSSVDSIQEQKYPIYIAPYAALKESFRLGSLTVVMFGDFIRNLFATGEVPDSVAGPVGIAQLTYGFVQEGFMSVLRFVALLSLSLAVLNILPLPALDGGRLLFILIEFIIGRRVDQKWEAMIHAFGYLLLLALIVLVTFNDVVRIFG